MTNRIFSFLFLLVIGTIRLSAQVDLPNIPNAELIRGSAYVPYPNYSGSPWLSSNFQLGEIKLSDGTIVKGIGLRYSAYRDELIYYNTWLQSQIIIDRISILGFSYSDENHLKRTFVRLAYPDTEKKYRFFEILSEGKITLLAYRKVMLEPGKQATVKHGLEYNESFYYYMYTPEKGFSQLNLNRNSLISRLSQNDQRLAKKLFRRNRVYFDDEASFIKGWNLLKDNGIALGF